jgi:O-antigen ligase
MPHISSTLPWYKNTLAICRCLLIAQLIFLMFSPPLTNVAEGLLYLIAILSPEVRGRLLATLRQPLVAALMVFAAVLVIGMFYGSAPRSEAFSMLTGWRRLLMLPLGCALFDETPWKMRLLWTWIVVSGVCAVVSFFCDATHLIISHYEQGIVVRNHATQGMVFCVAAYAAAVLLRDAARAGILLTGTQRIVLLVCTAVLLANIVLITSGRSGYLAIVVCLIAYILTWARLGHQMFERRKLVALAVGLSVVAAALLASPVARDRIEQGLNEARTYKSSDDLTSIGIRIVFLENTLPIVRSHPWFGVGTGGFRTSYLKQTRGEEGWEATGTTDPHDQFLKILAEQGAVGLAVFLAFIASAFRQRVDAPFRTLGLGILCTWCATSLFNSHFSTFSEGRLIFIWCGVMLAMPLWGRAEARDPAAVSAAAR